MTILLFLLMLILNVIQSLIWKEWIAHYVVFHIWKSSLSRHIQQVRRTFHYLCIWQNPRWRILTNRCSFIMHASLILMRRPPPLSLLVYRNFSTVLLSKGCVDVEEHHPPGSSATQKPKLKDRLWKAVVIELRLWVGV